MLHRIDNWESHLSQFLIDMDRKPFEWGKNDCCTFAAEWIKRCTGRIIELPVLSTQEEANAILESRGGIEAAVTAELGAPIEDKRLINRGDVGLIPAILRPTPDSDVGSSINVLVLAVCTGIFMASPGRRGVMLNPRDAVKVAWAV